MSAHETSIEVLKAGLLDSVQDLGRPGQARIALSRGGAMDRAAMTLANALVGNAPTAAGLEITGPGPTLRLRCDVWLATVGARHALVRLPGEHGGSTVALPTGRPVFVAAGSVLRWHAPPVGWRSWIAVAGGLALPQVLGSRSAHLASGIGPARLETGRVLQLDPRVVALSHRRAAVVLGPPDADADADADATPAWGRVAPRWAVTEDLPREWPLIELPVLAGRHLDVLPAAARDALFDQDWTVGAQSNRQGLRVHGRALDTRGLPQLASEPVSVGTVQLPPAGEPVILLAEHQTTGGYPRILEVASAAEPLLAQAGAGCRIRFRLVGLDEADELARRRARELELRLAGVRQACPYPVDPADPADPSLPID
ncbi:MAG: biotin-dependent carboxyltransferase family protein [Burkholderiales bacterium]|nr:MAG: biotin-dependent carboxyltransferase family protein [Burkholderiales bacterium]